MIEALAVAATSFLQQICSSMNSRARNRSSYRYHAWTAFLSHGFFTLSMTGVFAEMAVTGEKPWGLIAVYIAFAGIGSLLGTAISVRLERFFGAEVN